MARSGPIYEGDFFARVREEETQGRINQMKALAPGLTDDIYRHIAQLSELGYARKGEAGDDQYVTKDFSAQDALAAQADWIKETMYHKTKPQMQKLLEESKGFDEEGNIVLGDDETMSYHKLDRNDFANAYRYAQESGFKPKTSFQDHYQNMQAKNITKTMDYLGQDASGQSVFKNKSGIIDRMKTGFEAGLKRQFGEKSFDKTGLGVSNQVAGENKAVQGAFAQPKQFQAKPQSQSFAQPKQNQFSQAMSQGFQKKVKSEVPQLPSSPQIQSPQVQQQQAPQVQTQVQQPQAQQQDPLKTAVKNEVQEAKTAAIAPIKQSVQTQIQPYQQQSQSLIDQTKTSLMGQVPDQYKQQYNQAQDIYGTTMKAQDAIANPQQALRNYAAEQIQSNMGGDVSGQLLASIVQGADPQKALLAYTASQAGQLMKNTYGDNTGTQLASSFLQGGSLKDSLVNTGKQQLVNQSKQALQSNYGSGASTAGVVGLTSLLQGGDIKQNIKKQTEAELKREAKKQAIEQGLTQLGAAATPAQVQAAAEAYKILKAGGNTEQTGDASARAAARIGLASATGGLSEVVNPETMRLASGLQDRFRNSGTMKDLGTAGQPLNAYLGATSQGLKVAADVGDDAMNVVGAHGANMFSDSKELFKDSKSVLKNLTSGNIGDGLKGIGSTASSFALNNLKTVGSALKSVGNLAKESISKINSAVGSRLKKIFCFHPDTLVIMSDNSLKKISEVELGDEMKLGGKVLSVSKSIADNLWDYEGILVTGSHMVLEDETWKEVQDSERGVLVHEGDIEVISIVNEQHLIMTEDNQIWLDTQEVDDKEGKTDEEIYEEVNSRDKLNRVLGNFVKEEKNG